jgi:hypothetical protein
LVDLYIVTPNVGRLIKNNYHISGLLQLNLLWRATHMPSFYPFMPNVLLSNITWSNVESIEHVLPITFRHQQTHHVGCLNILERFTELYMFAAPSAMYDLTPLASMERLRILDLTCSTHIDSLIPLQGLQYLLEIRINRDVFYVLPEADRYIFNPLNNFYADRVHVYYDYSWQNVSQIGPNRIIVAGGEMITLSGETIYCFDFLTEIENLTYLRIRNSYIAEGLILPRIET